MKLIILGQIMGGKNNVLMTRTGHKYPNPKWAAWRDKVVASMKIQAISQKTNFEPIKGTLTISLNYWKGDLRRRDVPAILDSLWHCLERAGIIEDDSQLCNVHFTVMGLNRLNARVEMEIWE